MAAAWRNDFSEKELKVVNGFIDIVQCELLFHNLDYHASHSLFRTAKSPEAYPAQKKSLQKSSFVSSGTSFKLKYKPSGGKNIAVGKVHYDTAFYRVR